MSTGSIGQLGYDDDQDQGPYDDTALLWQIGTAQVGIVQSGIFDCSRFSNIGCTFRSPGTHSILGLQWTADLAGTQIVKSDQLVVSGDVANDLAFTIPHAGPYINFTLTPQGGAGVNWTPFFTALQNNRLLRFSTSDVKSHIINLAPNLPAGGTITAVPISYHAGHAVLCLFGGSQGITIELDFLNSFFLWRQFFGATIAANTFTAFELTWPLNGTRMIMTNSSGAAANNTATAIAYADLGVS